MSTQNYAFIMVLAKYPIETSIFLLLSIGPIMIHFGANRDSKGTITNYNSTVSILGWIMTVGGILAISYYIYHYYIAKYK